MLFYDNLDTPTKRTYEGSVDLLIRVFEGSETIFIEEVGNVIQWFVVTILQPLARKGSHAFLSIGECLLPGRCNFT